MNKLATVTPIGQNMKFFIKYLVTFTEEILNGKLHFLCSEQLKRSKGLTNKPLKEYTLFAKRIFFSFISPCRIHKR